MTEKHSGRRRALQIKVHTDRWSLDRVKWAAAYYVALGPPFAAMALMAGESPGAFVIFQLLPLPLCGPILGLALILVPGDHW